MLTHNIGSAQGAGSHSLQTEFERIAPELRARLARKWSAALGDEAEDAAQDAMLAGFIALQNWRGEGELEGYLFRVGFHRGVDSVRKRRVRGKYQESLDAHLELESGSTPEQTILEQFEATAIRQMIMALPEQHQKVTELHYLRGYSIKEISQLLGLGESNVKAHLMRARRIMRVLHHEANSDV